MLNRKWMRLSVSSTLVSLFVVAGCGTGGSEPASDDPARASIAPCTNVDVSALRQWGQGDYFQRSLAASVEEADLVTRGTVVGVHDGFDLNDEDSPNPQLIIEFRTERPLAAKDRKAPSSQSVFVVISQGPIVVETDKPYLDLGFFRKALPAGTEAILFLRDASERLAPYAGRALATYGALMTSGPQGIVLDNCGRLVGGADDLPQTDEWKKITTGAELESAIRDAVAPPRP